MSFTCCKCGHVGARGILMFGDDGTTAEYCRLCRPFLNQDVNVNPFEGFTVQHVHDENNQKVKVNSLKELRAAEKRYGFALAAMSDHNVMQSGPPTNDSWAGDIRKGYEYKWARDPGKRGDMKGVSVGSMNKEEAKKAASR